MAKKKKKKKLRFRDFCLKCPTYLTFKIRFDGLHRQVVLNRFTKLILQKLPPPVSKINI